MPDRPEQEPVSAALKPRCPPCSSILGGFACPRCNGRRLVVTNTKRPCAGLKVRYIRCTTCKTRLKSEERLVTASGAAAQKKQGH